MTGIKRSPRDYPIQHLDNELIARGAGMSKQERQRFDDVQDFPLRNEIMAQSEKLYLPKTLPSPDESLNHISTSYLIKALILKIKEAEDYKAIRGRGIRQDMHEIDGTRIQQNARAVASIWMKDCIEDKGNGFYSLKHGYYGKSFNLHRSEPYYNQTIARGRLCTGFLVKPDVIATAGHCAENCIVTRLRFVFGYRMKDRGYPVKQVPGGDVYRGVEILERVYAPRGNGADWALVKLDRKVKDRQPLTLSEADIRPNENVYVLGHPCGLPLKLVAKEPVTRVAPAFFSAELTIYGGNSGSPVFDSETHEVVGIVVRGDQQDFRWTGEGWLSIRYPNPRLKSCAPQCTRVSEFIEYCR